MLCGVNVFLASKDFFALKKFSCVFQILQRFMKGLPHSRKCLSLFSNSEESAKKYKKNSRCGTSSLG